MQCMDYWKTRMKAEKFSTKSTVLLLWLAAGYPVKLWVNSFVIHKTQCKLSVRCIFIGPENYFFSYYAIFAE